MQTVNRCDKAQVLKPIKLDNGWLKVQANLTKAGVFEYRAPDGSIKRELRHPDEVTKADSMATLELVPVTLRHPPTLLNADNTKDFAVGSTGSDIRVDGTIISSQLLITDKSAVSAIEKGATREISCGYRAELINEPGVWNGIKFDARQTNIQYNHVSLEPIARLGPDIKIHMDAMDKEILTEKRVKPMITVKIDGVDFEVSEQVKQALESSTDKAAEALKEMEAKLDAANSDNEKLVAKVDGLNEDVKKIEAERNDAIDPEKIQARINERLSVEKQAVKLLGDEEKFDGLSDSEIKLQALKKVCPNSDFEGKSDEYISARFDHAIETAEEKPNVKLAETRKAAKVAIKSDSQSIDLAALRKEAKEKQDNAWKRPMAVSKDNK